MKILILEDNLTRVEKFKQLFKNQELYIFDDILEALDACEKNDFQILFIDHDLDNKIWVHSQEENTGWNFIRILINRGLCKNSLFYLHTMNPIGANRMLNMLLDRGYDGIWIPFHRIDYLMETL